MKAVLISIKPRYCELIATGKKTIEVRKSKPKIKPPFKCYIYVTKNGRPLVWGSPCSSYIENNLVQTYGYSKEEADRIFGTWNGKVIGEFVCDEIDEIAGFRLLNEPGFGYRPLYEAEEIPPEELEDKACLDEYELENYLGFKGDGYVVGYAWHISELKIYDEPMELSEFRTPKNVHRVGNSHSWICDGYNKITKAPQSWMFVEELK